MKEKKYRILIGLREIAGFYSNLKKGFKEKGVECTFINLQGHIFEYGGDDTPNFLVKLTKEIGRNLYGFEKNIPNMSFLKLFKTGVIFGVVQILKTFLFFWAMAKYDVFIFGANSTFLFYLELPVAKIFGKKVIYIFHGSDSRPIYLNGSIMGQDGKVLINKCIILTKIQKLILRIIEKYAFAIINYPPQAYFHKQEFIKGLVIGFPYENSHIKTKSSLTQEKQPVRILHAASNMEARGTAIIRKIIKNIKKKGYNIDYIELIRKPNNKILEELRKCDFVVDEVYSDSPLAGLATEAAFLGKPTIVGGYYSDYVMKDYEAKYIPPSLFCHPDKLEESIEKLIKQEKYRKYLGARAQSFVQRNWRPKKVAERFIRILTGNIPMDWNYDPREIKYLNGYGLSEKRLKKILQSIIRKKGIKALGLSDKPELERLFYELSKK